MKKISILVVDDEPGIRTGISRVLNNFQVDYPFMDETIECNVFDVESGEEALEFIKENHIDIMLLDNKLPGISGVEVLEIMNKNQIDILVMMITSHASLETAVKATRKGAYDFVPKPFTPQELRVSIENATKHLFLKRMTQKLYTEGKQIRFQFLSILSHELKAPLNALENYLIMIKDRQVGNEIERYDQIVLRSLERISAMRNLIMDMLDLTQIETGNAKRDIEDVDIMEVIQNSIESMNPYAIQKEIQFHIDGPEKCIIAADKSDMEIIFNNLTSNAIKYNKDKGEVTYSVSIEENNVKIKVIDTGIGIQENLLPSIFNEFKRIKSTETKNISGSGLGLSIVKKLLDSYNGHISVKSQINIGSTFVVTIPLLDTKTN